MPPSSSQPPLPIFDRQAAEAGRDQGMANVQVSAGDWSIRAAHALKQCAKQHAEFIVDDVWRYMDPLDIPPDGRAMGPVLHAAARHNLIWNSHRIQLSARRSAHRNPRPVWQSLIFEDEP